MIRATGMLNGFYTVAEYNGKEWRFNGNKDDMAELELNIMLECLHPVGGTYVPKSKDDPLNIINVLGNYFFDMPTDIIETDEQVDELPNEKGVIY